MPMEPQPDILLLHADPAARAALTATLTMAGYHVAEAASGAEGLRLAVTLRPTIALLAQTLPDLDGVAVCAALRAGPETCHILCALLAATPPADPAATALVDLADAWLVTPFHPSELLALVRLLLRTHAAEAHGSAGPMPTELLYQDVVQTAIDGFWIVRASDARFLMVNDAYCRMTGYSRAELLTMRIADIEAIERPQDTAARITRLLRQGFDRFETRHRHKNGTIFDVEVSARVIQRTEVLIVVFARDITATKQIAQSLRQSEARYRSLLSAIPDSVFRHDTEGRFSDYYAPSDAKLLMPPEAFLGKHYRDVLPPVVSEPFTEALALARNTGTTQRFEYDLPDPDGTIHSFEARVVVGEDRDVVAIVRDITDRRQAERARYEQHQQLLTIFDAFPEILYVVDPLTDEVLFLNKVFQQFLGRNPIGGKCYYEFQGLTARCSFCTNELILRTRRPHTWEFHNPVLNLDLLITDQIIRWPDGRAVRFEVAIDITARKQAEATQERLSNELARKNRELEQIVYVASHDLRSPLVNVQGFSRELQASLAELGHLVTALTLLPEQRAQIAFLVEEDIPESLRYIQTGVSKMDALLKGLLRLSRLGRAALTIMILDLNQIVAETLVAFDFQIKQSGVTVEVGPLPPCRGDVVQVGQIFANLISNALKYLAPERPGRITITGECTDGMAVYCVADNGLGIAAEHHDQIFELYYRLNPMGVEGDGLGLTIVRTIVDRHGGWVQMTSLLGIGSQFFVALPEVV